jgi:hypothetical protein
VADIAKFRNGDVFQAFSAAVEVFVDFEGRFLHYGVRIFASTPKEEILPSRYPGLVVVFVEAQSQQGSGFFRGVGCFHDGNSEVEKIDKPIHPL